MSITNKASVSIISGIAEVDINDLWLTIVDDMVKLLLNRDFGSYKTDIQYFDILRRNEYYAQYDGYLRFVLRCIPVNSITSVYGNPYSDDPNLLVVDDDYYINLQSGFIELNKNYSPTIGRRMLKVTYNWDYDASPAEVITYANYLCAFLLESGVAKNSEGKILKEVEIGRYREAYATASTALKAKYSDFLTTMESLLIQKYKVWE